MRLRNVKGSREQIAANEYKIKDAEQIKEMCIRDRCSKIFISNMK